MLFARRFSALLLAALTASAALADEPIKRIPLERAELSGTNLVAVTARVEAAPNAILPRHTHPGIEMTTCISGELDLMIEGQPARHVTAGEHFQIPLGAIHSITFGAEPTVLIGTFVVEKDKPLSAPAS